MIAMVADILIWIWHQQNKKIAWLREYEHLSIPRFHWLTVLESSEWPTVGIFSGSSVHMGDYSECLKSEAPRFRGRYCLVSGVFRFNLAAGAVNNSGWTNWPDENASVWAVINEVTASGKTSSVLIPRLGRL